MQKKTNSVFEAKSCKIETFTEIESLQGPTTLYRRLFKYVKKLSNEKFLNENQTRISLLIIKSRDTSNGKIGHFLAYLFDDSIPFTYDIPWKSTHLTKICLLPVRKCSHVEMCQNLLLVQLLKILFSRFSLNIQGKKHENQIIFLTARIFTITHVMEKRGGGVLFHHAEIYVTA